MRVRLLWSLIALVLGLTLISYCFRNASLEVRLFFIYCGAMLAGGLRTPAFEPTNQQLWPLLLQTATQRYWFLPSLVLLFAVLWCAAFAQAKVIRCIGLGFASASLCRDIEGLEGPAPMYDVGFRQSAAEFDVAPPGTHVIIPIYPGGKWKIDLS